MNKFLLVIAGAFILSGCNPDAVESSPTVKREIVKRFSVQQVYSNSIAYIVTDRLTGCEFMKLTNNGGSVLLRCDDSLKEKY